MSVREAKARFHLAGARLEESLLGPVRHAPKMSVLVALAAGMLAGRLPIARSLIYKGLRVLIGI